MDEGFIDLRHPADHSSGGESFWPSFTDLMMVVLMIFMIASTILMLRNWDLVRELRMTIAAEEEAQALARDASRTSATLEERLAQTQHELSVLRMRLMHADEEKRELDAQLADSRRQVAQLDSRQQQLSARLEQVRSEKLSSEEQLARLRSDHTELGRTHAGLQARYRDSVAQLAQLEKTHAGELEELRRQQRESQSRLVDLQGDYDDLSVKYDKLVKPARTAAGKYVVSVRYSKAGGRDKLEFKESEDNEFRTLSRKQLDTQLTRLKSAYPGKLYVKVIIPEDSGLSYNEAWRFTQDVLTSYDYYHQGD